MSALLRSLIASWGFGDFLNINKKNVDK